ncbi:MAG: ribonuclease HII [Candidatus Eisenbacteria bacterium]|uniref:Ribonuclease HII n=1 Tax=Eiseniibacteriota bacterium TaxID=2212470 RepID=A0A538TF57_UNCEI|nr:MAG: ribonuclease HII [Candidatus Eisenbacteria bacterium]TMQ62234.1 MAG: ribonuclease HII [Candidatus Eisenbacteria bacterium]
MARRGLARFDDEYRIRWGDLLAGVDEAGRGPLAGPVVAACVVLRPGTRLPGVRDSKVMTPLEREEALEKIRAKAVGMGVGVGSVMEVDAFNIRMASLLAMRRAIEALGMTPQGFLVDGMDALVCDAPCEAVIDGDAKSLAIAAASVLAKVTRDAMMDEQAIAYPLYGFESNKGYATPEHFEALRIHGPCDIHRKSFRPVRELLFVQEVIEGF